VSNSDCDSDRNTESQDDTPVEPSTDDIVIDTRGAAGTITLARPSALNALTDDMRARVSRAMPVFANDPIVYAAVVRAEGRAFCAGGDVRQVLALAEHDITKARRSFADEYRMNWMLECFPKPQVSLINGLVVGSGAGLTAFGTHPVAGPDYAFAMPEVAIGLFPDVGMCHVLSRMPDNIGTYLALTGAKLARGDALALGLVTHCVDADNFDGIHDRLADADPVDTLLAGLQTKDAGETPIMDRAALIDDLFAGDRLQDIFDRIDARARSTGVDQDWAQTCLATLQQHSPFSLAITLRHLRQSAGRDLRSTLIADYRLACACLDNPDFAEGVRAMLIDKDRAPSWADGSLTELDWERVEAAFQPRHDELDLPAREDMLRLKGARSQSVI